MWPVAVGEGWGGCRETDKVSSGSRGRAGSPGSGGLPWAHPAHLCTPSKRPGQGRRALPSGSQRCGHPLPRGSARTSLGRGGTRRRGGPARPGRPGVWSGARSAVAAAGEVSAEAGVVPSLQGPPAAEHKPSLCSVGHMQGLGALRQGHRIAQFPHSPSLLARKTGHQPAHPVTLQSNPTLQPGSPATHPTPGPSSLSQPHGLPSHSPASLP